jgi:hypothetical protein
MLAAGNMVFTTSSTILYLYIISLILGFGALIYATVLGNLL